MKKGDIGILKSTFTIVSVAETPDVDLGTTLICTTELLSLRRAVCVTSGTATVKETMQSPSAHVKREALIDFRER